MPGFRDWVLIGLAEFGNHEFKGKHHPACFKAGVVVYEQGSDTSKMTATADAAEDYLHARVQAVNLMPESHGMSLDGIVYTIIIPGNEINSHINLLFLRDSQSRMRLAASTLAR